MAYTTAGFDFKTSTFPCHSHHSFRSFYPFLTPLYFPHSQIRSSSPNPRPLPPSHHSQSLPTPVINIRLQLPGNRRRHPVLQPHVPQQRIVPFLIQKKLTTPPEPGIDLAVLVQIGRVGPGSIAGVEVKDGAFADVDEETDTVVASVWERRSWLAR